MKEKNNQKILVYFNTEDKKEILGKIRYLSEKGYGSISYIITMCLKDAVNELYQKEKQRERGDNIIL